jgi:hypothetical protein
VRRAGNAHGEGAPFELIGFHWGRLPSPRRMQHIEPSEISQRVYFASLIRATGIEQNRIVILQSENLLVHGGREGLAFHLQK